MNSGIKFLELLSGFHIIKGTTSQLEKICGSFESDPSKVVEGSLFIAIKGISFDAHQKLEDVIKRGAEALLVQDINQVPRSYGGIVVRADDTRFALGLVAKRFYKNPAKDIFCVGVTGTNGKTSITYLTECILNSAGILTGVIGTVDHHVKDKKWPSEMTTPDPVSLIKRIQDMKKEGIGALSIEVSSHALDQERTSCLDFDVAQFSNLTRDHLDYHQTFEKYFKTKERFFSEVLERSSKKDVWAIINNDDEYGLRIKTSKRARVLYYGSKNADIRFRLQYMDFKTSIFDLDTPAGSVIIEFPMSGFHNIYNCCAAVGVALAKGISLSQIQKALFGFQGVPGRLQPVINNKEITVLIDYAHTPDALENVLKTLSAVREQLSTVSRPRCIITVFGCGGDRDKGKRPEMATIAERYSDFTIATSDNPRTEEPHQIIEDLAQGFSPTTQETKWIKMVDRKMAIGEAISRAKKGDVVLIAGKGHEDYQIIGTNKTYFNDYEVAKEYLK
jgi:UDP-N-acetylmuramoyl-L-alanyl-D-glutamate--2,6-diaminopimelate ligase